MIYWFWQKPHVNESFFDALKKDSQTFNPNIATDKSWNIDAYQIRLDTSNDQAVFERATSKLLRYELYPRNLLQSYRGNQDTTRSLRPGDYILHDVTFFARLIHIISLVQVVSLILEPTRRGFTYFTTNKHIFEGEFTVLITKKDDGNVYLLMHAISRPKPNLPILVRLLSRRYQKFIHRKALTTFAKHFYQEEH